MEDIAGFLALGSMLKYATDAEARWDEAEDRDDSEEFRREFELNEAIELIVCGYEDSEGNCRL
jgi:hypothetical protein